MGLTFTLDTGFPGRIGDGRRISCGSIAFDTSYPTGGEAITIGDVGFQRQIDSFEILGGGKGFQFSWDKTNSKIIANAAAYSMRQVNPTEATSSLVDAAGDVSVYYFSKAVYVVGFSSIVTTLTAVDVTVPVISLDVVDADGSSNRTELATITYADADAVGALDSYFTVGGATGGGATTASALATPYLVAAGKRLILEHKTQGADGTSAAGAAIAHVWVVDAGAGNDLPNTYNISTVTALRFIALGW